MNKPKKRRPEKSLTQSGKSRKSTPRSRSRVPKVSPTLPIDENLRGEIKLLLESEAYQPLTIEQLRKKLDLPDEAESFVRLAQTLGQMENNYEVVKSRKGKYLSPMDAGLYPGVVMANSKGFAFIRTGIEGMSDIFVGRRELATAMNKDKVVVRMKNNGNAFSPDSRPEGEIVKILERQNQMIIGTLQADGRTLTVYPDDQHLSFSINVPYNQSGEALPGQKVVVEIINFGNRNHVNPLGKVVRVLGYPEEKGVDMLSVMCQHDLPDDFTPKVLAAAKAVSEEISPSEMASRRDLRHLPTIAIDGIDTKDRDDAVSLSMGPDGSFSLAVHIADVSYFVAKGSLLDQEAFARGTSVYLPDRVLPMLPPVLSNGICSLDQGEDRLAMSCLMELSPRGKVEKSEICLSLIQVDKCLDYDTVNRILLDKNPEDLAANAPWVEMLGGLAKLQQVLHKKRQVKGCLDFDMPETKIIMDETTGKVQEVKRRDSRLAEKLIEQAMVITNEVVGTEFAKRKIPFIYRVHEQPSTEKLELLNSAIGPLGYGVPADGDNIQAKALQKLLNAVKDKPESDYVHGLALRSMSHARYDTDPIGHFALGSKYYSHFTSPIRRYSDLAIHQVIREWLLTALKGRDKAKLLQTMGESATQASIRERVAEAAERDAVEVKACEFMAEKIGEVYAGKVSGLNARGVFVQLENTVEGRIGLDELPEDNYVFHQGLVKLQGIQHTWQLGDKVQVKVIRVSLEAREIDFALA